MAKALRKRILTRMTARELGVWSRKPLARCHWCYKLDAALVSLVTPQLLTLVSETKSLAVW
jgi:hypothetical protein